MTTCVFHGVYPNVSSWLLVLFISVISVISFASTTIFYSVHSPLDFHEIESIISRPKLLHLISKLIEVLLF